MMDEYQGDGISAIFGFLTHSHFAAFSPTGKFCFLIKEAILGSPQAHDYHILGIFLGTNSKKKKKKYKR